MPAVEKLSMENHRDGETLIGGVNLSILLLRLEPSLHNQSIFPSFFCV